MVQVFVVLGLLRARFQRVALSHEFARQYFQIQRPCENGKAYFCDKDEGASEDWCGLY
jgi:hypothetical protein